MSYASRPPHPDVAGRHTSASRALTAFAGRGQRETLAKILKVFATNRGANPSIQLCEQIGLSQMPRRSGLQERPGRASAVVERSGHIVLDHRVEAIQVGHRHRRDLGDLTELLDSIRDIGMLQPITISRHLPGGRPRRIAGDPPQRPHPYPGRSTPHAYGPVHPRPGPGRRTGHPLTANGSTDKYRTRQGKLRWRARWDLPVGPDGQRRRQTKGGFKTKTEADQFLRQTLVAQDHGPTPTAPTSATVGEYLDRWLDGKRIRPTTRDNYLTCIQIHTKPRIGGMPLGDVTHHTLNALYRELETHGKAARPDPAPKSNRPAAPHRSPASRWAVRQTATTACQSSPSSMSTAPCEAPSRTQSVTA